MTETSTIGTRALIANFALKRLQFLIGTWRTKSRHPPVPDKVLEGRTSFEWHMGGAFQTNTITAQGRDRLVSQGRMSRDGGAWEDDLSQEFRREG